MAATGRVAVGPPEARCIVVLAPHPDDESLGCGGLIALASRRGASVTVVFATDGDDLLVAAEPRDVAGRRRAQGAEACEILGARPAFLGFPDGRLGDRLPELASALDTCFAEMRPDLVVLPWPGDAHPDHRALNRALAESAIGPDVIVWGCEIWSPLPVNRLVDISDVIDDKSRAVAAHTADALLDPDAVLGLNRYRAGGVRTGAKYAEAFLEATAAEYRAWVASLDA